jgi:hypothetical protein
MYSCSYGIRNFFRLSVLKVPLCGTLGHIGVYCCVCAVCMAIGAYWKLDSRNM